MEISVGSQTAAYFADQCSIPLKQPLAQPQRMITKSASYPFSTLVVKVSYRKLAPRALGPPRAESGHLSLPVTIVATRRQACFHAGILGQVQNKRAFPVLLETRHRQCRENVEGVAGFW